MRYLALALISALLFPALTSRSWSTPVMAAGDPVVLSEAQARCPMDPFDHHGKLASSCVTTRRGNAATPNFDTPTHAFGIAYSFNCGSKPRTFRMAIGLPGADLGVSKTTIWVTKRKGRGYEMVSDKTLADIATLQYPNWSIVMEVELKTICAWHVVVVQGDVATTKAHVPAIPPFLPYSAYADQ